jgi:glycosyltransferase involved in cell wall biosynthesis
MNICLINNLFEPYARGGAEEVVKRLALGLIAAGHHVSLITASPDGDDIEQDPSGLMIYRLHPSFFYFYTDAAQKSPLVRLGWHVQHLFSNQTPHRVGLLLDLIKPDVVHTHNLMGLGFQIPKQIQERKLPHVHTVHDVQLAEPSGIILKPKEQTWRYTGFPVRLYTHAVRNCMGVPDVVISPSHFLQEFYTKRAMFAGSQIQVLRNPLTVQSAHAITPVEAADPIQFLYLGQVEVHKGIETLLEAWERLPKEVHAHVHLRIAGTGGYAARVEAFAKKYQNVDVLGRVSREELPGLFDQTDMTIVPSWCYENSPTVIFESFARRVPVIASRVEGIVELMEDGVNGYVADVADPDALCTAIVRATKQHTKLPLMGAAAREGLPARDVVKYVEAVELVYQEAMSRRSSSGSS